MKKYLTFLASLAVLVSAPSIASELDDTFLLNCEEISLDNADEQVIDLCASGDFGEATEVAEADLPIDLEASPADYGRRSLYRGGYSYRTPSGYHYSGHYGYNYGSNRNFNGRSSYRSSHYTWHRSPSRGNHWGRHGGGNSGYSGTRYNAYSGYNYGRHSNNSRSYGRYGYSSNSGYGRSGRGGHGGRGGHF